VPAGLWLSIAHPIVFFLALGTFIVLMVLLLRFIWRGLRRLFA